MDERTLIDEVKELFARAADDTDSEVWQIIDNLQERSPQLTVDRTHQLTLTILEELLAEHVIVPFHLERPAEGGKRLPEESGFEYSARLWLEGTLIIWQVPAALAVAQLAEAWRRLGHEPSFGDLPYFLSPAKTAGVLAKRQGRTRWLQTQEDLDAWLAAR